MSWILHEDYSPRRSVGLSPIGGGQALTSPKRHSLGTPLPYQLADTPQAAPKASEDFVGASLPLGITQTHADLTQTVAEIFCVLLRPVRAIPRVLNDSEAPKHLELPRLSTSCARLWGAYLRVTTSSAGCPCGPP